MSPFYEEYITGQVYTEQLKLTTVNIRFTGDFLLITGLEFVSVNNQRFRILRDNLANRAYQEVEGWVEINFWAGFFNIDDNVQEIMVARS